MAALTRFLGDLYVDIGLTRQAESYYLNALEFCETEGDTEGQMLLHKSLADIYGQVLGNQEMAAHHLDAIVTLAKKLGDHSTAAQAGKQLAELNRITRR
jgi:tetratricopeptide (TPR) repeat protein